MPIILKDYNWQQTNKSITISIPLKGVQSNAIDLQTTNKYIKANYPPYLFELFLSKTIDDTNSNCYITDTEIIFELCKLVEEPWTELEQHITKTEKMELKKCYMKQIEATVQARAEQKQEKRTELKRFAVKEQITIDTEFRNRIETIKKEETEKALKEMKLYDEEAKPFQTVKKSAVSVPLPRQSQAVTVTFTAREFPTPSRESRAAEEQEWLSKQAKARRSIVGFHDDDLRPEERNPQWLKNKGDEFLRSGNYLAAVSAYTSGIKLSRNFAALYVNRSRAQFALSNWNRTIEDCSAALDLMTPICDANLKPRATCLARRGAALAQLGLLVEAVSEMEAASKLMPNDQTLLDDLKKIKSKLGSN